MTKQINMERNFTEATIAEEEQWRHVEQDTYEKPIPVAEQLPSKYHVRNIWQESEWIDFYMFYDQMKLGQVHEIGDSAIEHALKKLCAPGMRTGGKSKVEDIEEAIWSLQQAVRMIKNEV